MNNPNTQQQLEQLVTPEEARDLLNGPTPARSDLSFEESDTIFYRLINTVLQQQDQIERLRQALNHVYEGGHPMNSNFLLDGDL